MLHSIIILIRVLNRLVLPETEVSPEAPLLEIRNRANG